MNREEFYTQVSTLEDGTSVGVSHSDYDDTSTCLLQVGAEGSFTCAYLSNEQAKQLSDALLAFLGAK